MIRIIRYEGQPVSELLNRASAPGRDVTAAVEEILSQVAARGDEAALDYCEKSTAFARKTCWLPRKSWPPPKKR